MVSLVTRGPGTSFIRTPILGRNGRLAFGLDQSCCECDTFCCGDCPDLFGYVGDLCLQITGAFTSRQTLERGAIPQPPYCDTWFNPGEITPDQAEPCADFWQTLDVTLICKLGELPKLIVDHGDDPTCNLDERGVELAPDTLDCRIGLFRFVRTVSILGGSCGCNPMSLTFTITKGPCSSGS